MYSVITNEKYVSRFSSLVEAYEIIKLFLDDEVAVVFCGSRVVKVF